MPRIKFRELDATRAGRAALRRFYNKLYVAEFPDPHERESLANMARYLALRAQGGYGANNYHVLVAERGGRMLGGAVFDYFAGPNAGVLEFLFTRPGERRRGLGRALLDASLRILQRDARAATGKPLRAVVAEMNDPLRRSSTPDNMDPSLRAEIWGKWGFGKLDFPYVQPALSPRQKPVATLALVAKLHRGQIETAWLLSVIREYMRWAMRLPQPSRNPQYRAMARFARRNRRVALVPLQRYVSSARASSATVLKPRASASRTS